MKKNQIANGLLFFVIILFAACNEKGKEPIQKPDIKKDEGKPVAQTDESSEGMISYDLAVRMSKAYKSSARKVVVEDSLMPDAVNIKFGLERLKNFIARIENSFTKADCKPELGIRFYYVRYPNDMHIRGLEGLDGKVANHHSLMMVPFYVNKRNQEIDFNVDEIGKDPCSPLPYYLTSEASKKKLNILLAPPQKKYNGGPNVPLVMNHGGLTPPPDEEPGTFPTPSSGTVQQKNQ